MRKMLLAATATLALAFGNLAGASAAPYIGDGTAAASSATYIGDGSTAASSAPYIGDGTTLDKQSTVMLYGVGGD